MRNKNKLAALDIKYISIYLVRMMSISVVFNLGIANDSLGPGGSIAKNNYLIGN